MIKTRGFEVVTDKFRKHPNIFIDLPIRSTAYSAGYDFYSPVDALIPSGDKVLIWTDVKSYMQEGEVLLIDVRSSIGIKKGLMLANTIGIIDMDYYSNESNDGNIGICLYNTTNNAVLISKGERIAQGIFIPFLVAQTGNTDNERVGGIGSTSK